MTTTYDNDNDHVSDRQGEEHEVIKLYETSREREKFDEQANLYAIILATEHLERAYARDAIEHKEYAAQCKKLLSQFKMAERASLPNDMTTETFMAIYQMDCPRAVERLFKMGIPEPIKGGTDEVNQAAIIAETVQMFITTMDAVKLEQRAVDELQPLLSDLMHSITRVPDTPTDFSPTSKIHKWLLVLNQMKASDEISDDDSRQLFHDLDSAYTEFTRFLRRTN